MFEKKFGYDSDIKNDCYIVNEEEAKVIKFVFDSYAKGYTLQRIVDNVADMGFSQSKNKIVTMLKFKGYEGVPTLYYGKLYTFPAIVSKDVFSQVQIRRKEHKTEGRKTTKCFFCKNACTGGCEWSRMFKPVKGWTAKRRDVFGEESYYVYECPKFEEG